MTLGATPSQTVGPYFKIGLTHLCTDDLAPAGIPGERITIEGQVLDANGEPVPDAMIEIWQANSAGHYLIAKDDFSGFGRTPTDEDGRFLFRTIKPGAVEADGSRQSPHINVAVFMRGLLRHLVTRIYFAGEPANDHDPTLALVPEDRRRTLYATPASAGGSTFAWNIILQGGQETVFFDW